MGIIYETLLLKLPHARLILPVENILMIPHKIAEPLIITTSENLACPFTFGLICHWPLETVPFSMLLGAASHLKTELWPCCRNFIPVFKLHFWSEALLKKSLYFSFF